MLLQHDKLWLTAPKFSANCRSQLRKYVIDSWKIKSTQPTATSVEQNKGQ